jgi:uncharacterized membrane protein
MAFALFTAQLASTWFMTGLIWFVQIVHYPLFASVGHAGYRRYQALHVERTSRVVVPVMLVELVTAVAAVWARPRYPSATSAWLGLALLAVVWITTFAVQVPAHGRLADGFNEATHRRLVSGNWIRTAAWSARALLLLEGLVAFG